MNQKAIAEFEHYLNNTKNKQIYFRDKDNSLIVRPSLLNFKIMLDLGIIAGISWLTYDGGVNPIAIVCAYLFFLTMLWIDLQSLNALIIDLSVQSMRLKRANPIERFLVKYFQKKNDSFDFAQVSGFSIRSNDAFSITLVKYFVNLNLKEGRRQVLFSFTEEGSALAVTHFLSSLIKLKDAGTA